MKLESKKITVYRFDGKDMPIPVQIVPELENILRVIGLDFNSYVSIWKLYVDDKPYSLFCDSFAPYKNTQVTACNSSSTEFILGTFALIRTNIADEYISASSSDFSIITDNIHVTNQACMTIDDKQYQKARFMLQFNRGSLYV